VERITFQVLARSTERLDKFLADQLSLSRTQAARIVAGGSVTVNEKTARASRTLSHRDTVVVELPNEEHSATRVLKATAIPLDVVTSRAGTLGRYAAQRLGGPRNEALRLCIWWRR